MGHHHHGGGGGHRHHHHHHGSGWGALRGGFGGGWGGGRGVGTSWPLAAVLAILLLGYAAIDGFGTYHLYAHGQRGMGVVTHVDDGTTILEVEGRVCAVSGEYGHVGGMLPVAFPAGRPAGCIVRQMTAFRWPGIALLLGGFIIAGILVWRRGATSGGTTS